MTWHRNMHLWLGSYIRGSLRRKLFSKGNRQGRCHVMLCFTDHFEPFVGRVDRDRAEQRVLKWLKELPEMNSRHVDSCGRRYRHTFFYPIDEYDAPMLEMIAELCRSGNGEIEIHLHHDRDDERSLRSTLSRYKSIFADQHGLLSREKESGEIKYGFVHGNWALDNSRPDHRWCGVNNELTILKETGCFADFTMPSAPDITQTSKINSIYYAVDDPGTPKSHDRGCDAGIGSSPRGDLLLVQGPLALKWYMRKGRLLPSIENGEIGAGRPPDLKRFRAWTDQRIQVKGREEWIFVKLFGHGALEKNADVILGRGMDSFLGHLEGFVADQGGMDLHYVTAREMVNIIKAAEDGLAGNPDDYRDYRLVRVRT